MHAVLYGPQLCGTGRHCTSLPSRTLCSCQGIVQCQWLWSSTSRDLCVWHTTDTKAVQTWGTDNRLALEEHREHAGRRNMVTKKKVEESRVRGVESVTGECGKLELDALLDREPMKMLKDGRWMGVTRDNVTSNNPGEYTFDTLKPVDIYLSGTKKQSWRSQAGSSQGKRHHAVVTLQLMSVTLHWNQGSHFYWKKIQDFSRTPMNNFPGPVQSPRMFKYKEKRHLLTILGM